MKNLLNVFSALTGWYLFMSYIKYLQQPSFILYLNCALFIKCVWINFTSMGPKVFKFLYLLFKPLDLTFNYFFSCFVTKSVGIFKYWEGSLQFWNVRINLIENQWSHWWRIWGNFIEFCIFFNILYCLTINCYILLLQILFEFFLNIWIKSCKVLAVS